MNESSQMSWPVDADGDVLRRLQAQGFNFSEPHTIDFNVEFRQWPPTHEALKLLRTRYPNLEVVEPDADSPGYVSFQVLGQVSYEHITSVQRSISSLVANFGGACESWGVLSS
jgi:Regulator of ribonuclease activity B